MENWRSGQKSFVTQTLEASIDAVKNSCRRKTPSNILPPSLTVWYNSERQITGYRLQPRALLLLLLRELMNKY